MKVLAVLDPSRSGWPASHAVDWFILGDDGQATGCCEESVSPPIVLGFVELSAVECAECRASFSPDAEGRRPPTSGLADEARDLLTAQLKEKRHGTEVIADGLDQLAVLVEQDPKMSIVLMHTIAAGLRAAKVGL